MTTIVVPCFNEAQRLRGEDFLRLTREEGARLLFVDDGSTDGTAAALRALAARAADRIDVLALAENRGKAEAVRLGLLRALDGGATVVGYVDADLATPVEEISRLLAELAGRPEVAVVMGARVKLLGTRIERHQWRHYLGRLFATVASLLLALPVYDTQCGAKFFRAGDRLRESLATAFRTRWAFDVELIGRLLAAGLANVQQAVGMESQAANERSES